MMIFKKLFCKHDYKLVAKRKSQYVSDWQTFSDLGMYDDYLYECKKCGKQNIKTFANSSHPLYSLWKKI